MSPEDRQLLRSLLAQQRVIALATVVDGRPYASQLPFAARGDFGALLVHASGLAKHSRGLLPDAPFAALIQQPDSGDADPFQLARLTLSGQVRIVEREEPDYPALRDVFMTKLPTSRQTFGLGDFKLYELIVESGRFVAGFARAYGVSVRVLNELAAV